MFDRLPKSMNPAAARGWLLRLALLAVFAWLAGRFWHPYYGFTQFLQIDAGMSANMMPALRDGPVYIRPDPGSYDGGYYAQIATNPALDDPALKSAIDDAGYRARRILVGAVAWCLGGGAPVAVAQAYAAMNFFLWFGLAALLWRVFPVAEARATWAWAAVLFGAGVLLSVRLALTDLAALLFTAGAVLLVERGRRGGAAGLVGLAGLTRETAVLGVAALWRDWGDATRTRWRAFGLLAAALLPLALWLAYVHHALGGSSAGQRNLAWPLAGWLGRWQELAVGDMGVDNPVLRVESLLEHIALTVQVVYLLLRPRRDCPWWRVGVAYGALLVCLGPAVWGGFPNAAARVLLPLTLAFNVRAVRDRARLGWLLLGNLSVFAGVQAIWAPPLPPHELPAHSTLSSRHLLETDRRWSVAEWDGKWRWAWCAGEGRLTYRVWPRRVAVKLELQVRGVTPRPLAVTHRGREIWRGEIGNRPQWITLPELPADNGRLEIELRSETPPTGEGADNTARNISFALFGARLAE